MTSVIEFTFYNNVLLEHFLIKFKKLKERSHKQLTVCPSSDNWLVKLFHSMKREMKSPLQKKNYSVSTLGYAFEKKDCCDKFIMFSGVYLCKQSSLFTFCLHMNQQDFFFSKLFMSFNLLKVKLFFFKWFTL